MPGPEPGARVLAADGVFIWTVPQRRDLELSRPRARRAGDAVEYLFPAEYHGDPVNDDGVLVTFDWGLDLPALVEQASGMTTSVFQLESRPLAILGEHREVFVSCPSVDGWASGVLGERRRVEVEQELRDQLVAQARCFDDQRGQLVTLVSGYRAEVAALRASTSWRVTRPLRAVSGLARRVRGAVDHRPAVHIDD